jgi:putative oxidoreductase
MSHGESIACLFGRLVLGWFFLTEVYRYGSEWDNTAMLLAMKDVPVVQPLLALSLIMIVVGSLALALGYHARAGALVLFCLTLAASISVHDFWTLSEPIARDADFAIFARNIAIAGGLLFVMGMGPGRFALDNAGRRRAPERRN